MNENWKNIIGSIAPTLATALGGPLAGAAVGSIASALGVKPSQGSIAAIAGSLSTDQILALKKMEEDFALKAQELGLDLARINADTERAYLADTTDARKINADNQIVYRLGIAVLAVFAAVLGAVIYGSYELLVGGIKLTDVGVVASVSGLVGSVIGYAAGNAQQVVNYFFGSSSGSKSKTDAMADAIRGIK